jgi:CRISPR-associated endonuclease/helicase Cas3
MLLAKTNPEQDLLGHSRDACAVLEELLLTRLPIWKRRLQDIGYNVDYLEDMLRQMVALHDLGKAMEPWQRYIRGQGPPVNHSLFSMMLAESAWVGSKDVLQLAALLAMLSHHGQLHNDSYQDVKTTSLGKVECCREELNTVLEELGAFRPICSSYLIGKDCASRVGYIIHLVSSLKPAEKLKFKALYCFAHAILRLADNEASARLAGTSRILNQHQPAIDGFSKSLPATSPNDIQRQVFDAGKWVILRAGCGVGKTGAALAFAMEHLKAERADRIIFTLPTQFTSNSMYWDLPGKYNIPRNLRGLYHSEIEGVLKLEVDDEKSSDVSSQKYQNAFYNKPVTVSTVDHLLYSLLHCHKYADRAFGNIFTSVVIFDEVHYYDHFTLNKIGQCIELLRELSVPHMVMTATMPASILKRIQALSGNAYTVINQEEKDPARPYSIEKIHTSIVDANGGASEELIHLIGQHRGAKQMVVVNRVELAKRIAKSLKDLFPEANILCLSFPVFST